MNKVLNYYYLIKNNNNNSNNNNNNSNNNNRPPLYWNQKKCSVVHVKRRAQVLDESGMRINETATITSLGEGKHYRFLGVLENEMSCPWIERRAKKDEETTPKNGPMMWELKQRYSAYRVEQYNVIIGVLGGYSKHLNKSVRKVLGARTRSVLERMQKSVISNTLKFPRTFMVNT